MKGGLSQYFWIPRWVTGSTPVVERTRFSFKAQFQNKEDFNQYTYWVDNQENHIQIHYQSDDVNKWPQLFTITLYAPNHKIEEIKLFDYFRGEWEPPLSGSFKL